MAGASTAATRKSSDSKAAGGAQTGGLTKAGPQGESLRPIEGINYDVLPTLAGFWIRRLQIALLKSYGSHLGDQRPVESAALILLANNNDMPQNALAAALSTDQSTMVAISTKLEERGWVERRRQASDRRYQVLNLTPAGRKAVTSVKKSLMRHNENMLKNLSPDEREILFSLIVKIVE